LTPESRFVSKALGPLPIINTFLDQLRLEQFFHQFVPARDPRLKLTPAEGLGLMLCNILIARRPLYAMSDWAIRFDEQMLGLPPGGLDLINDDRVGRSLDALFRADRAAMLTAIVVHAIETFDVDLSELHNDSTTVTFTGRYQNARGQKVQGIPTLLITNGFNKDHRPDLKQLLWILTTAADGTIPIWCSVNDGNTSDDQTHIRTWDTLCRVTGRTDFLYVADSKLCTKENMEHITSRNGRFLTILPKTRSEDAWFREWLQTHPAAWIELSRKRNSRRKDGPDDVYRGCESPLRSVEGYRILWIWSSQKQALDRVLRQERIERAVEWIEQLRERIHSPRSRLRTRGKVESAAAIILEKAHAERWIEITVEVSEEHLYTQATAGRPGKNSSFRRQTRERFDLTWRIKAEALRYDDRCDGIFPLILNDEKLSLEQALDAYKHQPSIEKRHEQLKSVLDVMPVNLKSPVRIEAFLFLYFLALLTEALIERALRNSMKREKITSLPLYPEGRACKAPTANRIFEVFEDVRRHQLVRPDDSIEHTYCDQLTDVQRTVLRLFGQSPAAYFAGKRGRADA
jgi:transposase